MGRSLLTSLSTFCLNPDLKNLNISTVNCDFLRYIKNIFICILIVFRSFASKTFKKRSMGGSLNQKIEILTISIVNADVGYSLCYNILIYYFWNEREKITPILRATIISCYCQETRKYKQLKSKYSSRLLQSKVTLNNIKIANIFKDAITSKKNGGDLFLRRKAEMKTRS